MAYIGVLIFILLVLLFNKLDDSIELIKWKSVFIIYTVLSLTSMCIMQEIGAGNKVLTSFLILMDIYMVFTAYTDLVTKQIYLMVTITDISIEILFAVICMDGIKLFPDVMMTLILTVVVMVILRFGVGDYGLMLAYILYIFMLSGFAKVDYMILYSTSCIVVVTVYIAVALVWMAVQMVKTKKKEPVKVPFAPAVLVSYLFITMITLP